MEELAEGTKGGDRGGPIQGVDNSLVSVLLEAMVSASDKAVETVQEISEPIGNLEMIEKMEDRRKWEM